MPLCPRRGLHPAGALLALLLSRRGIETTLIFHDGFDLPYFASFILLESDAGLDALRKYYSGYLDIASGSRSGFILETPTWRAKRRPKSSAS